jgi:hypothetical protein
MGAGSLFRAMSERRLGRRVGWHIVHGFAGMIFVNLLEYELLTAILAVNYPHEGASNDIPH